MIIPPTRRALVALAVPALLLAACGAEVRATVGSDAATDDGPVDGDAIVAEDIFLADALPPDARFVEMSSDLAGEPWPVFLQQAVVRDDRIDVAFSGGEAPCFVVDHLETDESEAVVIVSVFVRSAAPEQADCAGQEVSTQAVTVHLEAPLGDRALLDGSRTVRPG